MRDVPLFDLGVGVVGRTATIDNIPVIETEPERWAFLVTENEKLRAAIFLRCCALPMLDHVYTVNK